MREDDEDVTELTQGETSCKLIRDDDLAIKKHFEIIYGETQADVVDEMIEDSSWSEDLPQFVGGKGSPAARRQALIAVADREQKED